MKLNERMTDHQVDKYQFKSPFDQAKYNFTKRLSILTAAILFLLGSYYFVQNDFFYWPSFGASTFALITYFILTKTGKIKLSAIFAILSIEFIIITKLFMVSHFNYYEDFFWIICISMFAFFVLDRRWGIGTLLFNMLFSYLVFFLVRHDKIELIDRPYNTMTEINFALNLSIGGLIFILIVLELLKQNKESEAQYLSTHHQLEIKHEEKTVMLREIHHRVKNNLQIVTSLLRLHANDLKDSRLTEEFTEAINRISAIAKIHDKMYNNENLSQINLAEYLEDLVSDILKSTASDKKINTEIHSTLQFVKPKDLVPIALIFNELVTNSIKHAFINSSNGFIKINAIIGPDNKVTIRYSDSGEWREQPSAANSLGLELIDSFVDQLDGTFNFEKTPQTQYTITFEMRD